MLKIQDKMLSAKFIEVRAGFIARARIESGRIADARQWMIGNGFEILDIPDDQLLADDGREILRAHGKAWVLKPEIHAKRLAEAFEQANKQRDAAMAEQQTQQPPQSADNTICTVLIDGQLCGGAMSSTPVCPRCTLGKQGVAQIMTCDVCGAQTAVMR